jgi:Uma2 family endonuclease
MTPPPGGPHNIIADDVHWAIRKVCPRDIGVYQTLGVQFPVLGKLYIPDLCVCPVNQVPVDDEHPVTGDAILLAVEITSKDKPDRDRKTKLWAYAHGPVPLYLLIDRFDPNGPTVTLYSEPADGGYRRHTAVPFGESVKLPAPFSIELSTVDFPTPA